MPRPNAVTSLVTVLCLSTAACEAVLGSVDVTIPVPRSLEQTPDPVMEEPPLGGDRLPPGVAPAGVPSELPGVVELQPPPDDAQPSSADAGPVDRGPDAAPPPPPPVLPRPVVVAGAVAELERVGLEGGSPRLGRCDGGVIIGVRPTANPQEGVFGERVTFVEPICGSVSNEPATASMTLFRDDSILVWEVEEPFEGVPPTEVPDDRLLWVPQPEILCPETAPVLVGLSGEYDPVAPDSPDTAAVRSLVIECAPLVLAPDGVEVGATDSEHVFISQADTYEADGDESYISFCEDGTVTTQLRIHAGYWLDGFALGCSGLRSPRLDGEPCSADADCQSDACAPEGACVP
jgi:hypothetical protein